MASSLISGFISSRINSYIELRSYSVTLLFLMYGLMYSRYVGIALSFAITMKLSEMNYKTP
jgi:hypothetical protein